MSNENEEVKQLITSNAKAIQALANSITDLKQEWQKDREGWQKDREEWQKDREEWQKDRKGIYELLGRLTRSMADFYETQSDFYNRFDKIEERQARMLEILDRFDRDKNG